MRLAPRPVNRVLLLLLGGFALLASWVVWLVARRPEVPFLTRSPPAEWIVYSAPASTFAHPGDEIEADFRKSFVLEKPPAAATLSARCFHTGAVTLNGTTLPFACDTGPHWKRPGVGDVSALLHPGTNEIAVQIKNRFGPPAVWLSISGPGLACDSDASWEARLGESDWQPARLARTPMDRWPTQLAEQAGAERDPVPFRPRVIDSALKSSATWIVFVGMAAALLIAVRAIGPRLDASPGESVDSMRAPVALVVAALAVALWTALTWNNLWVVLASSSMDGLDRLFGFDVDGHLEYVQYILQHGSLPLANEGWEMYQPPLYYLMAVGALKLFGHMALDQGALALMRLLNWAGGIVILGSLFASLRLLFAEFPRRWVTGIVLGAFLPAQLYMSHYVSNEIWAAAWASASISLGLFILRRDIDSAGAHLLLGALMGAALLTKFSTLVVVAVIFVVLIGRRTLRQDPSPRRWVGTVCASILACGIVCGWHFVRVWRHFGSPITGNWDAVTGFSWWQDPGYHTVEYYTSFGQALQEPIFSAFHSFADAIYSTLWGDGMIGGSGVSAVHPPWNYDLMAAGYLLALLPTIAILVGTVAATIRLVRTPRAEWFLLLGVLGGQALGIFYMTLRLPFYAQAKAFYGLPALVPLSIFAAWGFDLCAIRSRPLRVSLDLILGVWALNACASFWIHR
jgi:hypothetical protein